MRTYYHRGKTIQAFKFDGTWQQLKRELPNQVFQSMLERQQSNPNAVETNAAGLIINYWPSGFCGIALGIVWSHDRMKRRHRRNQHYKQWARHANFRQWEYHWRHLNNQVPQLRPYYAATDKSFGLLYRYQQCAYGLHIGDYVAITYNLQRSTDEYHSGNREYYW